MNAAASPKSTTDGPERAAATRLPPAPRLSGEARLNNVERQRLSEWITASIQSDITSAATRVFSGQLDADNYRFHIMIISSDLSYAGHLDQGGKTPQNETVARAIAEALRDCAQTLDLRELGGEAAWTRAIKQLGRVMPAHSDQTTERRLMVIFARAAGPLVRQRLNEGETSRLWRSGARIKGPP